MLRAARATLEAQRREKTPCTNYCKLLWYFGCRFGRRRESLSPRAWQSRHHSVYHRNFKWPSSPTTTTPILDSLIYHLHLLLRLPHAWSSFSLNQPSRLPEKETPGLSPRWPQVYFLHPQPTPPVSTSVLLDLTSTVDHTVAHSLP